MSLEQIIFLALIQGITEFLPISSSGHLSLVDEVTSWPDQGVLMDVAVHVGTLLAVLVYFRRDVLRLVLGAVALLQGRMTPDTRLLLLLALATVPVVIGGALLYATGAVTMLRGAEVVAWANLVFAGALWWTDRAGALEKRLDDLSTRNALLVGLAQVCALVPGASRAGVTMSMARWLGFTRTEAARFSMLLSIPTVTAAGSLGFVEAYRSGDALFQANMVLAAAMAFFAAIAAIAVFMRLLEYTSLTPFVLYRLALGVVLLGWLYVL